MPYVRHRELKSLTLGDPLWRFVDFSVFVAMLSRSALFMTRIDKLGELGDKFEGHLPGMSRGGLTGFFRDRDLQRYNESRTTDHKKFYYANCWHRNEAESDAMWKLYVKGNQGIAIFTTFRHLKDSLKAAPQSIWIGEVQYRDKWEQLPGDVNLHACMTKRDSFRHEQEVRAIWCDEDALTSGREGVDRKEIPCKLAVLIQRIYLAPGSGWFRPTIEDVLRKYEIEVQVVLSDLDTDPSDTS